MRTHVKRLFTKLLGITGRFKKILHYVIQDIPQRNATSIKKLNLTPIEQPLTKGHTKWVLAETTDMDNKNRQLVLVEVEQFDDADTASSQSSFSPPLPNYTIEGEDPNLRITHYPSNRLH